MYTPKTLAAWIAENPDYNKFPGTVSGAPMIYQAANEGSLSLDAKDWLVWDRITEFPDLSQTPSSADISTTGKIARSLIATVPDAPSPSDLTINLGEDTDEGIDAIEGIIEAYQDALAAEKRFYIGHFMGVGKKSEIYQAALAWTSGLLGAFPDPVQTALSVTPNLGAYHKFEVITDTNSL